MFLLNDPSFTLHSRSEFRKQQSRLEEIAGTPLEPAEFCHRWVVSPAAGERGYQAACIRELASVCGLSRRTVKAWGADFQKRPSNIPTMLRVVDMLRQILPYLDKFDQIQE